MNILNKAIDNKEIVNIIDKIKNHGDFSSEGLEKLIPQLGLNNEALNEQPIEMADFFGKGLKIWQYPNQLSKFGSYIYNLSIESYLEIGCRWGGTFIFNNEILRKKNPNLKSYACDLIDKSELLQIYSGIHNFEYIQGSSQDLATKKHFGTINPNMVFIDGDHEYEGVKNDFSIFENMLLTKYIVLHDISNDTCPGVAAFWKEIKNNPKFDYLEFLDQYDSVHGTYLGIGLLIRK
jgi:cephalosporin hydroxylase